MTRNKKMKINIWEKRSIKTGCKNKKIKQKITDKMRPEEKKPQKSRGNFARDTT